MHITLDELSLVYRTPNSYLGSSNDSRILINVCGIQRAQVTVNKQGAIFFQTGPGLRPCSILAVLRIYSAQLFPNWTACRPITRTNTKIE